MSKPSLRQVAKELDISPAYLSYMVNGKRPWRKDLYQRYIGVVNTFVNSEGQSVNSQDQMTPHYRGHLSVDNVGAGRGTRTHTAVKPADFKSAASTIPPSRRFLGLCYPADLEGEVGGWDCWYRRAPCPLAGPGLETL